MTRLAFFTLAAALLLASCTTPSNGDPRTDSQTHWLTPCDTDGACAAGLACLCGVCTQPCDADACTALAPDAVCATVGDASFDRQCAEAPAPAPLCLPACTSDDACGTGFACAEGACVEACPDPGPSPDAFQCPPGERYALEPAADGCPAWGCYPDNDCPPREPFSGECAEGFDLVERPDANGCLDWECVPRECPVINIPQCPDGQEVQQTLDANGCPQLDCVPTDCPPIAAPPADSCPQGQRVALLPRAGLCPDWGCTAEGCEDVQEPELCFDGQPPSLRQLDGNGCVELVCAPERSFPCGDSRACSFDTQYCSISINDIPDMPDSYACITLPDTCLQANSCTCLDDAIDFSSQGASCEDSGAPPGAASLTVTYPGG